MDDSSVICMRRKVQEMQRDFAHGGGCGCGEGGEEEGRMLVADIDESLPNCLTWALFQRGDLDRQVEGPAVPGYALYTNTWLPIVPGLPKKYPNRWMSLKVRAFLLS